MKKILGISAATLVVLVLIASFVVYPSMAASTARDQIIAGIASVAEASEVKVSGVSVEVDGGNGISAITGGDKVGDISVRIARIELEKGAASGDAPQLRPGAGAEAAEGVRDILDAIEDVGSVELAVGDVVSGAETLPLNYSSFKLSAGTWALSLKVPQSSVTNLLEPLGVKFSATASGSTVNARIGLGDLPAETFKITLTPTDQGRSIAYNVDGNTGTEKVSDDDDVRLTKLQFSSADSLYSITAAGSFDYEAARADIEKALDSVEKGGPSPAVVNPDDAI